MNLQRHIWTFYTFKSLKGGLGDKSIGLCVADVLITRRFFDKPQKGLSLNYSLSNPAYVERMSSKLGCDNKVILV